MRVAVLCAAAFVMLASTPALKTAFSGESAVFFMLQQGLFPILRQVYLTALSAMQAAAEFVLL